MRKALQPIITYGLYPSLLAALVAVVWASISFHWDYQKVYAIATFSLIITLMIVERLFPLQKRWSMTWRSFFRDIKYIAIDAPLIAAVKAAFGILAIYYSQHHEGLFTHAPLGWSIIGFLLVYELMQYWYHRLSHTAGGKVGTFLWRVHVAHHLPDKVYVLMHAVFNPINAFLSASILQIPLVLLGISPETALAVTLLIDLQSMISHFNTDIRAGFLNYLFIGTETHRYHHSANVQEAKNYGNTLAIWDIVFGTFYYRPGQAPEQLGVEKSTDYPRSEKMLQVISLPFRKKA